MISLDDNKDVKTEYIMKEVDNWLKRVQTFREKKALDKLLE